MKFIVVLHIENNVKSKQLKKPSDIVLALFKCVTELIRV